MTASVPDLLAALGNTEQQVAETLRKGGYRGERGRVYLDPVAEYLRRNGVDAPFTTVDTTSWIVRGVEEEWRWTPDPVADFIRAFDSGAYPDLEEQS